MSSTKPSFPSIPEHERTPLIDLLLEFIQWQEQRIGDWEDEIQDLKKETKKPKFESSKMDEKTEDDDLDDKKRRKSQGERKKRTYPSMMRKSYSLITSQTVRVLRDIKTLSFRIL